MLVRILFIMLSLAPLHSANTWANDAWQVVSEVSYTWANDGESYRFVMDKQAHYSKGGAFTRLRIFRKDTLLFTVSDNDGIDSYSNNAPGNLKDLLRFNLIDSPYLLALFPYKATSSAPLIFLFGWSYASDFGNLHILALDSNGTPYEMANLKQWGLMEIKDLDNDKLPEVIGWPCMIESGFGIDEAPGKYESYRPYQVLSLSSLKDGIYILNPDLSEAYTRANYYGWAGIQCTDDYVIALDTPKGKKPYLVDLKALRERNAKSRKPA